MDHQDDDAVMCKRTYNKASGEWGPWETIFSRRRRPGKQDSFRFEFPKGGYVEVNTNSLPQHEQNLLAEELRNCPHFLQYYVQGSPEPRLHFLLNGDATETRSDPQPGYGYGYGQVRMKSLPLPIMKEVNKLADRLERKYRSLLRRNGVIVGEGCFWNIGVDCIIYRDGRDSMGDHADDSQGEELIVTVLVSSPVDSIRGRMVYIKPAGQTRSGNTKIIEDGDVEIMLFLKASDSYAMDDEMQKHYVHGVPKDNKSINDAETNFARNQRMSIVLRRGNLKMQTRDTGLPRDNLNPRVELPYKFGGSNVLPAVREGHVYSRVHLIHCDAHRSPLGGCSGRQDQGCASIIVSGLGPYPECFDNFFQLVYAATKRQGALGLLCSAKENKPIRVNRSSKLDSKYQAVGPDESSWYRFDGVYKIETVQYVGKNGLVDVRDTDITLTRVPETRVYLFTLSRCQDETDDCANFVADADYIQRCVDLGTMNEDALPPKSSNKRTCRLAAQSYSPNKRTRRTAPQSESTNKETRKRTRASKGIQKSPPAPQSKRTEKRKSASQPQPRKKSGRV